MVLKKLDPRIRTLIENGVKQNHRSLFLIIGDHAKDQVFVLQIFVSIWLKYK